MVMLSKYTISLVGHPNHYLNHMELYTHGTEPKKMVVFGKQNIEGMLTSYLDDVHDHNLSEWSRLYILKWEQNFASTF